MEQTMAAQDAGDSARRQLRTALEDQPSRQLASAPTAAHLAAQSEHMLFDPRHGALGRASRPARAVFKTAAALGRIAAEATCSRSSLRSRSAGRARAD